MEKLNILDYKFKSDSTLPFEDYVFLPFYFDGKPLSLKKSPGWGMSLKNADSMRFRWNEKNCNREKFLFNVAKKSVPVALEQNHTKDVFEVESQEDALKKIGDGIITKNKALMPVVTVADCVPIFFYDVETCVFGIVHSGWKGTGIAKEWLLMAKQKFNVQPKNVCVAIGAHINDCCYVVDKTRAEYFSTNFTPECVRPVKEGEPLCKGSAASWNCGNPPHFRLSLLKANLALLRTCGILEKNIVVSSNCTCCNLEFGSNRREMSISNSFTVQAAFVKFSNF